MVVRFLNKKTEIEEINGWLPKKIHAKELPGHTFCAVVDDKIVAIAGLRLMEGEICFIDSMATDQSVKGSIRHQALDEITKALLGIAKDLGFKKVFATTKEECIVNRAKNHGFKVINQTVIGREL
jgi:N-acetylglutamate synthase-like GNAT family acetyltransferase